MRKGSGDKPVTYDKKGNYDYNYFSNEYYIEILNGMFTNKTCNINKGETKCLCLCEIFFNWLH